MECNEPKDFSRSYTFGVTYDRYHKNLVHIPTHPTHTLTPHPHPLHTHTTRLQICKYFKSILSVTITFFSHTHQHYTHTHPHTQHIPVPSTFIRILSPYRQPTLHKYTPYTPKCTHQTHAPIPTPIYPPWCQPKMPGQKSIPTQTFLIWVL